jgi:hypothetical protein
LRRYGRRVDQRMPFFHRLSALPSQLSYWRSSISESEPDVKSRSAVVESRVRRVWELDGQRFRTGERARQREKTDKYRTVKTHVVVGVKRCFSRARYIWGKCRSVATRLLTLADQAGACLITILHSSGHDHASHTITVRSGISS